MTTRVGNDGVVEVGATEVAELKSWSLDESAAQIEDSQRKQGVALGSVPRFRRKRLPKVGEFIKVRPLHHGAFFYQFGNEHTVVRYKG